jgi:hypothetical protein
MNIWSDTNPHSTIQSRHQQQFSVMSELVLLEIVLQSNTLCLIDLLAVLTVTVWATLCYLTLPRWIFDKTYGSCMMVPLPVSVTLPEITVRLPILVWISMLDRPFTRLESPWFLSFGTPKRMWCMLQLWIVWRNCCSKFKMTLCWSTTLLAFFSTSVIPCIVGLKLMWQCKFNILSFYFNPSNNFYFLSLEWL